jgi:hypothetical protein
MIIILRLLIIGKGGKIKKRVLRMIVAIAVFSANVGSDTASF